MQVCAVAKSFTAGARVCRFSYIRTCAHTHAHALIHRDNTSFLQRSALVHTQTQPQTQTHRRTDRHTDTETQTHRHINNKPKPSTSFPRHCTLVGSRRSFNPWIVNVFCPSCAPAFCSCSSREIMVSACISVVMRLP